MELRDDARTRLQEKIELECDQPSPFVRRYARVLHENPAIAFELVVMASEIVDDFDDWGPVIQADEDGLYTARTAIERLRAARDLYFELVDNAPREPGEHQAG